MGKPASRYSKQCVRRWLVRTAVVVPQPQVNLKYTPHPKVLEARQRLVYTVINEFGYAPIPC